MLLTVCGLSGCAARSPVRSDYGIPPCPLAVADDLLSHHVLQCWLDAPHGRWRRLSHESHLDVLVVHVEALDTRDAEEIARRFVVSAGASFSEVLVYAQPESPAGSRRIRRVRWTREAGFEALEFTPPSDR